MSAPQWKFRPEFLDGCPGGGQGCVLDHETVARLLHSMVVDPAHEPFSRSELFPPRKQEKISNKVGRLTGVSVVRSDTLTVDEVRERSLAQANRRPGRSAEGAYVADVDALRRLKIDGIELNDDNQLFVVYDDPLLDEPLHAVIRASGEIPRTDQDAVRNELKKLFKRHRIRP